MAPNLLLPALLLSLLTLSSILPSLSCPTCPNPSPPPKPKPKPKPKPEPKPCPPIPLNPSPPPPSNKCPIDALKLDACVDVLGGLIHIGLGDSAAASCCPLISGLADLDAGLCLCTAIKAKLLNINVFLPIALEVLLDCGKRLPSDYKCPY
ncbi:36.4 kDa proline-rich protein-like [Dendrobium catenatum]|uniref:36.4 kDa proline-rich protein n=1 Tax=Dendrobium catenatum TaxID=906689 RepID=A0A2I0WNU3_9ASPA|nr:36.4 kDa proline-rich protein-like [Dendrobium catenatum]PKU77316.1 36.4 kDa proline-rich protein [Dendrobium catenatum]